MPPQETILGLIKMATKDSQQNSGSKSSNSSTPKKVKNKKLTDNKSETQEELEEKLIHENYGLVVSQALCFLDDNNFEDYIQAGLIGLLKAIRTYDENKAKFSTFASVCIRNAISTLNKKVKKLGSQNLRGVLEHDKIYNSKENIEHYLPDFLSEEHKFIIKLKIQGYTNAEIGSFMSCTKKDIKCKIEIIIKLLQEYNT